jgi:hypothetical protein
MKRPPKLRLHFLILAVLFCKLFAITSLQATEAKTIQKKHNLSIVAVLTEDHKNLKEWIEYHRLVGVDHFYLYSTNKKQPYLKALIPYISSKIVSLISWQGLSQHITDKKSADWALAVKTPAFQHAILCEARKSSTWITFLEVGEFLVPSETCDLSLLLEKYKSYPGIILKSDTFDASSKGAYEQKLLIETLGLIKDDEKNILDRAEKTILKPELCESFTWPPYKCVFKSNQQARELNRQELRVNRYIAASTNNPRGKLHLDSKDLTEDALSEFLDLGYEVEDQERPIQRFLPELTKKMGE